MLTGSMQKNKSFTVRDLPQQERPRERLEKFGAEALSAQELLALILGRGVGGEPVMTTAQKLLAQFGSIEGIAQASLEDLQQIKGIGLAKAAQLHACMEMARRSNNVFAEPELESGKNGASVVSPQEVYRLVHAKIQHYAKEHFLVLSFDVRNKLLGVDVVSVGTLTASLVHPRETFDAAIRRHASHIIVAHNHPSNDTEPSASDIKLTKQLVEAGKILDIHVLDHIIVSRNNFLSFKEQQLL
jgi:DNA repair protein RadC